MASSSMVPTACQVAIRTVVGVLSLTILERNSAITSNTAFLLQRWPTSRPRSRCELWHQRGMGRWASHAWLANPMQKHPITRVICQKIAINRRQVPQSI